MTLTETDTALSTALRQGCTLLPHITCAGLSIVWCHCTYPLTPLPVFFVCQPALANGALYLLQVVDELFSYWTLEDSEDTLEQLEELLIVSLLYF